MFVALSVSKSKVMEEVATTTTYTGGKMEGDNHALQRISTVDEDEPHLERFWEECRAEICQELIGLVVEEGMIKVSIPSEQIAPAVASLPSSSGNSSGTLQNAVISGNITESLLEHQEVQNLTVPGEYYLLKLSVSQSFDSALLPSMKLSLTGYFVHKITGRWYVYTNKGEAGEYANKATELLDDVHRKAMHKKKPTRPTY